MIAYRKNNFVVEIFVRQREVILLEFLWLHGLVYGYSVIENYLYRVFLKSVLRGFDSFKNLIICFKKNFKYKMFKKIVVLEQNSVYFVKTDYGFFSQKSCLKRHLGGYLLAKT